MTGETGWTTLADLRRQVRLLDVVGWLEDHPRPRVYLRQIDVPGVHSKFVEAHRGVLGELLDLALSPDFGRCGCAGRRSRFRPALRVSGEARRVLRFRGACMPAHAQCCLRTGEAACRLLQDVHPRRGKSFAALDVGVSHVFITENEINFLAFPRVQEGMVIFGAGYGFVDFARPGATGSGRCRLRLLGAYPRPFAILDALRARFGHAESFLMDRSTLLAFEVACGCIRGQLAAGVDRELPRLTAHRAHALR